MRGLSGSCAPRYADGHGLARPDQRRPPLGEVVPDHRLDDRGRPESLVRPAPQRPRRASAGPRRASRVPTSHGRTRSRAASVVALAIGTAALVLAAGASPSAADVVLFPGATEQAPAPAPTLLAPDGRRQLLAPPRAGVFDASIVGAPSPDRRLLAQTIGTRIRLLPTDGGRPWQLRLRGARLHDPFADVDAGDSGGSFLLGGAPLPTWWSPDGRAVLRDGLEVHGRQVVARCVLATRSCRALPVPRSGMRLASLDDGASLWAPTQAPLLALAVRFAPVGRWRTVVREEVRRARATLRRPSLDRLALLGPRGRVRDLWRRRSVPGRAIRSMVASGGGPRGALVAWVDGWGRIATRLRHGRLQASLRSRTTRRGLWRVTPDGQLRRIRLRPTSPARELADLHAAAGARGWLATASTGGGREVLATIDARGTLRPVMLAGRPLDAEALWSAAGLPPQRRDAPRALPVGYEQATDAAIVSAVWDERSAIVRVPLDGRPPTALTAADPDWPSAVAW